MECADIIDDISSNKSSSNVSTNDEHVTDAKHTKFTSKETLYYKMIDKFFKKLSKDDIQKMLDVIDGRSKVSLRLLDWFVTRYANKFKTTYNIATGERFNVHISYKAQLKSYKKRYFDPFRRRKKFIYYYEPCDSSKTMCTTIGQLNFFRWAFLNDVVKYVEDHYNAILKAMVKSNKDDKIRKHEFNQETGSSELLLVEPEPEIENTVKVVKKNISIVAEKKVVKNEVKIVLSFD